MPGPYDLYVFDLDGTLIDSLPDISAALNAAIVSRGFPARTPAEIRGFLGDGARELVRRAVGTQPSEETIDALAVDYRGRYGLEPISRTRVYPGVADRLARLGAPAAVLTNKPGKEARAIVDGLGLRARFVEVVGEGDGLPRKPDPAALLALVARLGARNPVYVGDSFVDAETAGRAKIDFAFVTWGYGDVVPGNARRVDHPDDL